MVPAAIPAFIAMNAALLPVTPFISGLASMAPLSSAFIVEWMSSPCIKAVETYSDDIIASIRFCGGAMG